jgi:hypothetical protein
MEKTGLTQIELNQNRIKISSVLSNNATEFGKHFMLDGNDDTCWNSDQGKFHYVFICFDQPYNVRQIQLTSSGGFCPKVLIQIIFMK